MAVDSIWDQLADPLRDIAMRLECLGDLVAFGSVCSSWRAAYKSIKPIWKPTVPWLIMAENNDDNPECLRTVVDLSTNRRYQMKLPETFGQHCWGCEHGWIFTLNLEMETHLFNPFTRSRLSLPSVRTLLLTHRCYDAKFRDQIMRRYINKVHVICVPPNDELLVMVIHCEDDLAIAKPGDPKWFSIESRRSFSDLVHYRDSIADLNHGLSLQLTKADFFLRMGNPFFEALLYPPIDKSCIVADFGYNVYLADDPFGSILLVLQYFSELDIEDDIYMVFGSCQTSRFEVHSFDFVEKAWLRLYDLGDRALFVGSNAAVCVVASKCSNCKPNCIYFTDVLVWASEFAGSDTGIFSMKDLSIERVYHGVDIVSRFCPPFWFMPKLV